MRADISWPDTWTHGEHVFWWYTEDEAILGLAGMNSVCHAASWAGWSLGVAGIALPSFRIFQASDLDVFMLRKQKDSIQRLLQRRVGVGYDIPKGERHSLLVDRMIKIKGAGAVYGRLNGADMLTWWKEGQLT